VNCSTVFRAVAARDQNSEKSYDAIMGRRDPFLSWIRSGRHSVGDVEKTQHISEEEILNCLKKKSLNFFPETSILRITVSLDDFITKIIKTFNR